MTPLDLTRIAFTAVLRHRLRTLLSLLGVAIGVSAVVLLAALGEGARLFVTNQFTSIGSNLLILTPGKNETTGAFPGIGGVPNELTLDDAIALKRNLTRIRRMAPMAVGIETVANGERRRRVNVFGSSPSLFAIRQLTLREGRSLPEARLDRSAQIVVLGSMTARELFRNESAVGKVVRIGEWRMRVIGVLAPVGMQIGIDMDDVAVIPVATAMQMFNRVGLAQVMLEMHTHEDMEVACPTVVNLIAERHGEEDVTCISQGSIVGALSAIVNALTFGIIAIAAVSLSVAGIGIMNVMLVSVSERTAEIGLVKAMGARPAQIIAVFLAEAVLLSFLGGVLGLVVGLGGIRLVGALFPAFPASAPLWSVIASMSISLIVGTIFGVLPARHAAGLDPIAALSSH